MNQRLHYTKYRILLSILGSLLIAGAVQAQEASRISGRLLDLQGRPIAGAQIVLQDNTAGATTQEDGRFSFETTQTPPFNIIISAEGYEGFEITYTGPGTNLNRTLRPVAPGVEAVTDVGETEEIAVTARRRKEKTQDVPIPISVVGGALIEETGAFNVNRVKELVPTVQLYSSNPRNTTLNIRGIGSTFGLTNDGLDPGVGFYVDGVYYARPAATTLDFIDVEQIEVLRGPQGTLFGKNTTAGAFNITTRRPSFKTGADFELSYGNYGFIQAKTSVTGPLTKKLAGRLSFSGTQRDGTIYNVRTEKYLNDLNNQGVRGQLLYTPTDKINILFAADATRQRPKEGYAQVIAGVVETQRAEYRQFRNIIADLGWQLPSENPFDRKVDQNSTWRAGNDLGGASLNVDAKIGPGTLTSTTAWRFWHWDPMNDRDFTGLNATAKSQATSKHNQWSQEVRYAGDFTKKLSGVVGVYAIGQNLWTDPEHIEEAGEHQWRFQQNNTNTELWQTPGLFDGHGSAIKSRLETVSAAVFANVDWAITPKLHVLPGLRYNYDSKAVDFKRRAYGLYQTDNPALIAIRRIYNDQEFSFTTHESNVTGQLTVAYKPIDKINTFVTVSNSYKPVGVNLGGLPNVNGQPDLSLARIRPEYVTHAEFGIKTSPTRRSILNLVAHVTDIKDYQTLVQDPDPSILRGYLANAERARVLGVELDGNIRLSKHFLVYGALAYTDGKYITFKNAPLPLEETGTPGVPFKDISGGRLPGISKWAGSLGGEVSVPGNLLRQYGKFFLGADTYYRSNFSSSPSPSKHLNIDGYALGNARIGFRATAGTSIFVWGRNILDTNYFEQLLPGAGNAGHYAAVLGDPRTYGITIKQSF